MSGSLRPNNTDPSTKAPDRPTAIIRKIAIGKYSDK